MADLKKVSSDVMWSIKIPDFVINHMFGRDDGTTVIPLTDHPHFMNAGHGGW